MASPLYTAFSMEQVPEREQGTVNSLLYTAWTLGWAVGPYISGIVQQRMGFSPLFITTSILYGLAAFFTWLFFSNHDKKPERVLPAMTEVIGELP